MAAVAATEPRRGARVAATLAAVLALASLPLHAWMLLDHPHGVPLTALMVAMALACLWCAVGALRSLAARAAPPASAGPRARGTGLPCRREAPLRHLWGMSVAMALLHVALLTGFPLVAGAHHHGGSAAGAAITADGVPGVGTGPTLMLLALVLELAVCFACASAVRARRPDRQPGGAWAQETVGTTA
jgi:hypothetical protein